MEIKPSTFHFLGYTNRITEGSVVFHYQLALAERTYKFNETLFFSPPVTLIPTELIKSILDNLLLILGISYWKTYCSTKIELHDLVLTTGQAKFWQTVYQKGLGEFFYKNQINFKELINFPAGQANPQSRSFPAKKRSLVYLGGGKDSLVTVELMRQTNQDFNLFIVNEKPIQTDLVQMLGQPKITVRRELDAQLFDLNTSGVVFNGHIPITAINAFIGLLMAVIYDFRYLVAANEASSNYGNVTYLNEEINHQWSKSLEFEKMFQDYVQKFMSPDIKYFSLMRPFTELKIIELFSKYPQYFQHFTSCNRNFLINDNFLKGRWCGKCPKCAFVFVALAAFLPKQEVINIFQKNLFADENLIPLFSELLGLTGHKPFECVGTPDETKYAFYLLSQKKEFLNDIVYRKLVDQVISTINDPQELRQHALLIKADQSMPDEFAELVSSL